MINRLLILLGLFTSISIAEWEPEFQISATQLNLEEDFETTQLVDIIPTYDIEKENLEAHIAIEAERWVQLNSKIDNVHSALDQKIDGQKTEILQNVQENNRNITKLEKMIIWAMGTFITVIVGAVITFVLNQ